MYRVREGTVEVCNGYTCWKERRFIAERRVSFLGFRFWWPVINGEWRSSENAATRDIDDDRVLRRPDIIKSTEQSDG